MKNLYLLRHATARTAKSGEDDTLRNLTPAGTEEAKRVGRFCHEQKILISGLWVSPFVRTQETAEGFSIGYAGNRSALKTLPINTAKWLAIGTDTQQMIEQIYTLPDKALLISHEPNCGALIATLLGANSDAIHIERGALTALVVQQLHRPSGSGRLLWSLPPTLMR